MVGGEGWRWLERKRRKIISGKEMEVTRLIDSNPSFVV